MPGDEADKLQVGTLPFFLRAVGQVLAANEIGHLVNTGKDGIGSILCGKQMAEQQCLDGGSSFSHSFAFWLGGLKGGGHPGERIYAKIFKLISIAMTAEKL
jgi:hypothetical protein